MKTSFVVMADTHFAAPGTGKDWKWWNRTLQSRSPEIADALVRAVRRLSPDFVVHCGDFTDSGDLESVNFGKNTMDRFQCPFFITLGNHDTWIKGGRQTIAPLFGSFSHKSYYTRDLGGIRFVFLDNAYWITRDGEESEYQDHSLESQGRYLDIGPSREELNWLKGQLLDCTGIPVILVAHAPMFSKPAYPVGTLPEGKPVKQCPSPYSDFISHCVHHEDLLRIVSSASNVKAVFCGHWHIFDVAYREGVVHCQTGSVIEFPFEMRLVTFDKKRLSVTTIGLNGRHFQEASIVHEWGNSWVAGKPEDREFKMDLA